MNINYLETLHNCESFYTNSHHNYSAKTLNGEGFTARIDIIDRTYYSATHFDWKAKTVIMEISPGINCSKEYISQTLEYISKINLHFKNANIKIESNGTVCAYISQNLDDDVLPSEIFGFMEAECLRLLNIFHNVVDKLAHGKLIEPEEADIKALIYKDTENFRKFLESMPQIEDEIRIEISPEFAEWLKRKKIENTDCEDIEKTKFDFSGNYYNEDEE